MAECFKFTAILAAKLGIHARTAEAISSIAGLVDGDVRISLGRINSNAKNIYSLLGLAATAGARLKVTIQKSEGYEECAALMRKAIEDSHLTERFAEYCHPYGLKLAEERMAVYV